MTHRSGSLLPVVGIVGAGQLARMTLQAAVSLDIPMRVLAARPDDGAALVWPDVMIGPPGSREALFAFAKDCDVLTFDHELVDPAILTALEAAGHCLRPSAAAQIFAQDKGEQRVRFAALGLPVPAHCLAGSVTEIEAFAADHGWPVVAKARRGGYDGRGVWVLDSPDAARALVAAVTGRDGAEASGGGEGANHPPRPTPHPLLVVEQWLPIERELAVLLARRPGGQKVTYPVVETVQVDGICHEVLAPAAFRRMPLIASPFRVDKEAAIRLGEAVADAIGVVGILAIEMFVVDDELYINEVATRPHNSGHYTIEGCVTSQFENHLRAVLDLPLGSTALTAPAAVMANLLGGPRPGHPAARLPEALTVEGIHVHLYGKESRPGRKIGHVTALGETIEDARRRAVRAAGLLAGSAR
jgi:5-(carboxyamino)imidazole ribonucleotide synthase